MKNLQVRDIIEQCNGKLIIGNVNIECVDFCTDTRKIKKDDTYVGLKGEKFNGSEFYKTALELGAKVCILQDVTIDEETLKKYNDRAIILVQDTLKALQSIAKYKRSLYNIPVIAITGSVGKTSTKDIIASVVSTKYKTLKTEGNFNNHIGVPLTILRLKDEEAMVVEMGMSNLGEISLLTNIAKPTTAVITNVGTAHIGNLGSRENILKAKTGGLIVIGDTKEVLDLVDGGFNLNVDYTPSRLYELAKMDGAIVLSADLKRILYANAQLIPSPEISTNETGTRHRTAERTAKQTGEIVISVSQRRNVITIFKGDLRYVLQDSSKVITKANQALQTAEKYKKVFDDKLNLLNEYEFNDIVTLQNVIVCIQRAEMVLKVVDEVKRAIYELGEEGRLFQMQLDELFGNLAIEETLIIKDYIISSKKQNSEKTVDKALSSIRKLEREDLMKSQLIAKILGYEDFDNYEEVNVFTRGYRILSKIPRMPNNIVENLVKSFKSFQHIIQADIPALDEVEGIGEIRAKAIKQSLKRMQEQFIFDNLSL